MPPQVRVPITVPTLLALKLHGNRSPSEAEILINERWNAEPDPDDEHAGRHSGVRIVFPHQIAFEYQVKNDPDDTEYDGGVPDRLKRVG